MTVGFMLPIDRALLVSEWIPARQEGITKQYCPSCEAMREGGHGADCAHDLALSERGYPDQASRDRARALLEQAESPTMAPPGPSET
jgi:hypothetical protein